MRRALLILCALAPLAGCDSKPARPAPAAPKPAAPKASDAAKADAAKAAAAPADAPPPFVYSYSPVAKRDPFHSPIDDLVASASGGATITNTSCNQPLCRWDLDQLKLVGVVTGMSNPVAMVEDPQGIGHLVRRNVFMGKKGGRVTQIKRDQVVVTEIFKGSDGKPHPTNIEIKMAADKEDIEPSDLLENEVGD